MPRVAAPLAAPLALALLLVSPFAAAQPTGDDPAWDGGFEVKNERRSDFTIGLGLGLAMGEGHGVMNEVEQLNDDSYEKSTGFAAGNDLTLWLGGAIRDWFVVSLGLSAGSLAGNDIIVGRQSFMLRLDTYPAYSLGGAFRDLGLTLDGGLGVLVGLDANDTSEVVFEGGSVSSMGVGVFWEGVRFAKGHFGSGPFLHYQLLRGLPSTAHTVSLGYQMAYYSGPRHKKGRLAPATETASTVAGDAADAAYLPGAGGPF